jgi:hypothetical protein
MHVCLHPDYFCNDVKSALLDRLSNRCYPMARKESFIRQFFLGPDGVSEPIL